jgi:hypothetical protein
MGIGLSLRQAFPGVGGIGGKVRVLVACEFSGIVRDAFIARGHEAVSCDLVPSERPGPHIVGDVCEILEDGWDMMIAHPPCTYLASSGLHWNTRIPGREERTHESMLFIFNLMGVGSIAHRIPKIALENPIGRISTAYRRPDQIIHPWQFGEDASKATCLWLKGLPLLEPTNELPGGRKARRANQTPSGQNKLGPSPTRAADRARTYPGIANAMADQWGGS